MLLPPDLIEVPTCLQPRERDRPLSFHWRTVEFDRVLALGLDRSADRQRNTARNAILTEAVLAHDEGRWVSYSRHKAFYVGKRRYHGTAYTHATIIPVIDELLRLELIEEERAASGGRGWQSRFRATPKLIEGLAGAPIEHKLCGLIRLKDTAGTLADFSETATTMRMRREMEAINAFLASVDLQLDAPDTTRTKHHLLVAGAHYRPTPHPSLYRVFNRRSFLLGGRAYGWWQSLPKAYRRQLLIDGEPTSEPDFSQMHASLLYTLRGQQLKHDAYETGEFSRDEGKLAFNVALNARTLPGAISALINKSDWPHDHQKTARLIEVLKRRNPAIAKDLHADRGVRLMRLDSDIVLDAVRGCAKADIPALPIHDAILTPARQASRVAEIMEASAARCLKAVSPCHVKVPGHTVPQVPSGSLSLLSSPSFLPVSAALSRLPDQLDLFPMDTHDTFLSGADLRQLRERLGLTQEQLARRLGIRDRSHIANIERGHDRLSRPRQRLLQHVTETLAAAA